MKNFLLPLLVLLLSFPSLAQEQKPAPPADLTERTALAREFQKVRPIRAQIDRTIGATGQNLPTDRQPQYIADMKANLDYKMIEEGVVKALAETFTVDELKALITFYSSPAGKSAAEKMGGYETKLAAEVRRGFDAALAKIKYGQGGSQKTK